jgi:hypothetical protein
MLTLESVRMLTPKDPGMQCERSELSVRVSTATTTWSELDTERCSSPYISIFRVLNVKVTQLPPAVVSISPHDLHTQSNAYHCYWRERSYFSLIAIIREFLGSKQSRQNENFGLVL